MGWVSQQNAKSVAKLETNPNYKQIHKELNDIILAKDRVPFSAMREGFFYNFWQDETHVQGILRRTTMAEYRKSQPVWETILDIDQLSKAEGKTWVYHGRIRMDKTSNRYLVSLSSGGGDAVVVREFDESTKQFIANGFNVPEAKSSTAPLDENHIYIGTDFGPGSMTNSGYTRILKLWTRGTPLASAVKVFEGLQTDVSASVAVMRDSDLKRVVFTRGLDFFNTEYSFQQADYSLRKLPLPTTAVISSIEDAYVYAQLKNVLVLKTRTIPSNSLIRFELNALSLEGCEVIFSANSHQAIDDIDVHKKFVYVGITDDIKGKVLKFVRDEKGSWQSTVLPFPDTGVISFSARNEDEDPLSSSLLTYTDFLTPPSQYLIDDSSYKLDLLKSAPARFDASHFEVTQNWVPSKDGTPIPYFLIKKKGLALNSNTPTVLYGYGGFEISMTPYYLDSIGKVWLEQGGAYAVANIRGGGEFGPQWHQAAMKLKRQNAYDDFAAVAKDLIATKVTSPRHLGIQGGSNGGLLTGVALTQHPELFNAVLVEVPLLDMIRYPELPAGDSWVGEYGDPKDPIQCANLLTFSPYQNVKPGVHYPEPFFTTSTKDDRVHPAHARKMAARMEEQGHPALFYENIEGGHGGAANLNQRVHMKALEFTYLWSKLR